MTNDKWIKDRLDSLQTELFEYSTQNRMSFEDMSESLKSVRSELLSVKNENAQLKTRLGQHEAGIGQKIEGLQQRLLAPRKILRDENGLITGVTIATETDS